MVILDLNEDKTFKVIQTVGSVRIKNQGFCRDHLSVEGHKILYNNSAMLLEDRGFAGLACKKRLEANLNFPSKVMLLSQWVSH